MDDRASQRQLATGVGYEVRAFTDKNGDLVIVWWDFDASTKEWVSDQGAKVPKIGLTKLAEFLLERL